MNDDLTLIVGGRKISGWTTIRVSRGIERCPSDFTVTMTELYPGEASAFVIQPGDPCKVLLGLDTVITGYVDRFTPSISSGSHSISVSGRGKCADLVDCAAEWPGGQISGSSVLAIAQQLALPYGQPSDPANPLSFPFPSKITVIPEDYVYVGPPIPQFNLSLGETPLEIIERISRYAGLLVYDDTDGNLVLSRVGTTPAGSGFTEGVNVQSASISYAADQMYSEYLGFALTLDPFLELGDRSNLQVFYFDPLVRRHRRKIIISEQGDADYEVLKKRVLWEAMRRYGRSMQLHVTTDGWRDSAGTLYTPNTLAPLSLPSLKLVDATWLISEVTYNRDGQSGTTCDLVIMPPEAFDLQPSLLFKVFADVPAGVAQ